MPSTADRQQLSMRLEILTNLIFLTDAEAGNSAKVRSYMAEAHDPIERIKELNISIALSR